MKKSAVTILKNGGVVVYPTDTLYGLVGQALNKKTVERIYTIKGRKPSKPLIVLISSLSDLKKFGVIVATSQKEFLARVWPGPVSVILPCKQKRYSYLHRGTNSLAFRMPKSVPIRAFLKKTGPLVAPSANPEGLAPAETIQEAKQYFDTRVDYYIARGRKKGNPSILVSLVGKKPEVLRGKLSFTI